MITLIFGIFITIIAVIGLIMLIWFLINKKPADKPDEKFVCPNCNESDCDCIKDKTFENK